MHAFITDKNNLLLIKLNKTYIYLSYFQKNNYDIYFKNYFTFKNIFENVLFIYL